MKNKLIVTALLIFTFGKVFGQWNFNLSTDHEYNDNPFHSPFPEPSFISSVSYGLERDLNILSVGYYGSFINFNANSARNFYWHQLSASRDQENCSYGIYAEQRIEKDIYTYFNYWNFTSYFRQQFYWGDFYFSVNPNFSLTRYSEISILDNLKGAFNFQINKGFETGTTIIAGGAFNYKKYLDPTQHGTYSFLDANNILVTESYTDRNVSSLSQITSYFRLSQSITETTGLAVQFTNRSIINGVANYAKDLNLVYGDESEIFDDPVNTEGNNYSAEFTQLLFRDLEVKAAFYLNYKNYPSQGLYDELGNYATSLMRADIQKVFNLSIKKSIPIRFLGGTNLSLGINYQNIINTSNSIWYNYQNSSLGVSFSFEL